MQERSLYFILVFTRFASTVVGVLPTLYDHIDVFTKEHCDYKIKNSTCVWSDKMRSEKAENH